MFKTYLKNKRTKREGYGRTERNIYRRMELLTGRQERWCPSTHLRAVAAVT